MSRGVPQAPLRVTWKLESEPRLGHQGCFRREVGGRVGWEWGTRFFWFFEFFHFHFPRAPPKKRNQQVIQLGQLFFIGSLRLKRKLIFSGGGRVGVDMPVCASETSGFLDPKLFERKPLSYRGFWWGSMVFHKRSLKISKSRMLCSFVGVFSLESLNSWWNHIRQSTSMILVIGFTFSNDWNHLNLDPNRSTSAGWFFFGALVDGWWLKFSGCREWNSETKFSDWFGSRTSKSSFRWPQKKWPAMSEKKTKCFVVWSFSSIDARSVSTFGT